MAKKVRRVKKKQQKKQTATGQPIHENAAPTVLDAEISAGQKLASAEQFHLEYAYVVKDLRRVLVLAAIMFALLIAANLLLQ